MTWTTARPTQAGWYWYREDAHSEYRVVNVYKAWGEQLAASGENFDLFDLSQGEWQGPIEPEE